MASHKPGSLKQSNKKHKGKSSKRQSDRLSGPGRINKVKSNGKDPNAIRQTKLARQNKLNQVKKQKRDAAWLQRRLGSSHHASKLIAVIPMSDMVDCNKFLDFMNSDDPSESNKMYSRTTDVYFEQFKTNCTFVTPMERDLFHLIDVGRSADLVIFLVNSEVVDYDVNQIIDQLGFETIRALKAIGCPETLVVIDDVPAGLKSITNAKSVGGTAAAKRKGLNQFLESQIGLPGIKILELSSSPLITRFLSNITLSQVNWRQCRSYLVTENVEIIEKPENESSDKGTVRISGFIRGRPLGLNSLMHITDVGACKVFSVSKYGLKGKKDSMEGDEVEIVYSDPEKMDSLQLEASPDGLMGEQTWPAEDEMNTETETQLEVVGSEVKPGFQADWFRDSEGKNPDEDNGSDDGDSIVEWDGVSQFPGSVNPNHSVSAAPSKLSKKSRAEESLLRDEDNFPDEMDTPQDEPARNRFARYRALQSFRASPWHPKENLPSDYSRIFQFENVNGTINRLLTESEQAMQLQTEKTLENKNSNKKKKSSNESTFTGNMEIDDENNDDDEDQEMELGDKLASNGVSSLFVEGSNEFIASGQFVTIELSEVDLVALKERMGKFGFIQVFGLFRHEMKLSVLHFNVMKDLNYQEPLKSKELLLFKTGFRSFLSKPCFSQANLNCDKHKFERFLPDGSFSVASCYGPIHVGPTPLLVFRFVSNSGQSIDNNNELMTTDGFWQLVASGSLSSVDPDRIMLKKIILTGFPIRVQKKFAVVKHLFYNPVDVKWFKPAELVSKYGLRGHIKEPVGTHGLFKAQFNAPIKQNDTVMLQLYKRVYPKVPNGGIQLR